MSDSNKNIDDFISDILYDKKNEKALIESVNQKSEEEQIDSTQNNSVKKEIKENKNTLFFFIRNLLLIFSIAYLFVYLLKQGNLLL